MLKYLRITKNYIFIYSREDLTLVKYTNSNFQTDKDSIKPNFSYVFTLARGAITWRSIN